MNLLDNENYENIIEVQQRYEKNIVDKIDNNTNNQ